MKVKAVRIHAQGAADVLRVELVETGSPGPDEILIRQTAIGLNFQDIYHRSGWYSLPLPSGLGTEAAGVVEQVGSNVTEIRPGDRVCYAGGAPGSDAAYRLFPADRVIVTPAGVTDEEAAGVLMKGMTVEYLLNRCYPVERGMPVLFHAAAGGVGLLAGQWGRHIGARMIGIANGPEKCALALRNGYGECIDRSKEDIVGRVRALTKGEGVPVVYDCVGKDSFEQSLHCLAPRGVFVSFGTITGPPPPVSAPLLQKLGSLYFTRPTLATYIASVTDLRASAAAVFDLLARGILEININQRYPLDEVALAHNDLERGRNTGSTLLIP
ncbi:quinone oxidoreductase [Bradyrhizobium sp. CCBAU 11434]|uniref:quinone oxidoreductase family protein n=1 Tax=Bradyrhizobium sp. CCBAU 11434 TaxID=1630885 RepID=UPI0023057B0C|nr:quinone oxidoreductase [Bradyrhizobium sp. CCBAU 11434]MDA9521502.1 quinone oxidoreductase [Bradyrhizobium sp. CCBAU 11434]